MSHPATTSFHSHRPGLFFLIEIYLRSDRVLSSSSLMVMLLTDPVAPVRQVHHRDMKGIFVALRTQVLNLELKVPVMESNLSLDL